VQTEAQAIGNFTISCVGACVSITVVPSSEIQGQIVGREKVEKGEKKKRAKKIEGELHNCHIAIRRLCVDRKCQNWQIRGFKRICN